MSPVVGCVICGSDRHVASVCGHDLREREMSERIDEWIKSMPAGTVVGRTPPRYSWWRHAWWRHALGWAFVLSVLGIGVWGLWGGVLWVVARLGAAWRGGG